MKKYLLSICSLLLLSTSALAQPSSFGDDFSTFNGIIPLPASFPLPFPCYTGTFAHDPITEVMTATYGQEFATPSMNLSPGWTISFDFNASVLNLLDYVVVELVPTAGGAIPLGGGAPGQVFNTTASSISGSTVTINSNLLTPTQQVIGEYKVVIRNFTQSATYDNLLVTSALYFQDPFSPCSPPGNSFSSPPCSDADGDGVCDADDDYPTDPLLAYRSVLEDWTTLMFEDLWPAYGDFDFNDMVVSTQLELASDIDNIPVKLTIKTAILAAGASEKSGFGLEFDYLPSISVNTVSGQHLTDGVILNHSNGLENGPISSNIIVFDNFKTAINSAGGPFFNTWPGAPVGPVDTIIVEVNLNQIVPLAPYDFMSNPYIFRTDERGREIHLPGFPGTSLANPSYYGKNVDNSLVMPYTSVDGLPFAIATVGTDYPKEKVDMVDAFLKFADWAQSGGFAFPDWHTNTSSTYRDAAKVY